MTRNHEKLLMAVLAGIIIAGAAAFAIQPTLASTHAPKRTMDLWGPSQDVIQLQLSQGN
jgi:integral membrane sensor domain MASE1